jgi:hypothetical protein
VSSGSRETNVVSTVYGRTERDATDICPNWPSGPVRPGSGEARPVLGPARQARLENRAGPAKHAGSISCPSPARNGPKRTGSARLARKKRAEKHV